MLPCNGGSNGTITVTASGGTGVLAYSLDGVNFQSSNVFNVAAGSYNIWVRDAGGCIGVADVVVNEPDPINGSVGWSNVSCNGASDGTINVLAWGGTGSIEYSLDGLNYQTGSTFSGLSAGTYTIYFQDDNNCVVTLNATITEPGELMLSGIIGDVSCAGGDNGYIDISVSGGTTPYSYSWSNGSQNEDLLNLVSGNYNVTVTDANGCSETLAFSVQEPNNPLIINGTITDATGATNADGSVDATVTGGTPPYTYIWNNGETTEDVSNLTPGVYTLEVVDANGCTVTEGFTVNWSTDISTAEINEGAIKLYPNPAAYQFTIDAQGMDLERVMILNLVGKVVYDNQPNNNLVNINIDEFSRGIYLVRMQIDGQMITRKLEVMK